MNTWTADLHRDQRAQVTLYFAILVFIVVLFTGLAIDAGILYFTKAKLTTSVDGACLAGMKTLPSGQATASTVANNIFSANYGAHPPTPSITFPQDQYKEQQVKVTATSNVNTLFMRVIPAFATVPVSATAVSTRGKLIMSIVLDRSGSMCGGKVPCDSGVTGDKGGEALQVAVPQFVKDFDDKTDEVGMISFASNASIDYSINYNFTSPITTAVSKLQFTGGTFGTGAGNLPIQNAANGPPLSVAGLQDDSVPIQAGQNIVKVVVYFTDGLMNTIQDTFACQSQTLLNYGGFDDTGTNYGEIFDPVHSTQFGKANSGGFPIDSKGDLCKKNGQNVNKFYSQAQGKTVPLTQHNITNEAKYRAVQTAISLRSESPIPTYIYTIGLGTDSTASSLLAQLANDPNYPTYVAGQPAGLFFYISSCPCTDQIQQAFQTIAAKVLLRLTQ